MTDKVILNKIDTLELCKKRINEVYEDNTDNLRKDQTKQDSILLNLERACQASIDLALRYIKIKHLGLPKESRDAFIILNDHGVIDDTLLKSMVGLVGFRNTAVHNYKKLDLDIVEAVITKHIDDFNSLAKQVLTSI